MCAAHLASILTLRAGTARACVPAQARPRESIGVSRHPVHFKWQGTGHELVPRDNSCVWPVPFWCHSSLAASPVPHQRTVPVSPRVLAQKVELAVKKSVEGGKVLNRDALKNPGTSLCALRARYRPPRPFIVCVCVCVVAIASVA